MWFRGTQDAILVRRALHGESAAFGVLVDRYLPAVRAQAYGRVRTRVDAEDVAQDAFLAAYEKLDTLREPQQFGAWLLGIGRHCAARMCERRLHDAAYAEQVSPEGVVEPQFERRELLELLRREVDRLDDATRETVLLHYFAGRTSREIALALDTTSAAVRKRLQRARSLLSERLLRDAARDDDDRQTGKRIMGLVATLPTDWKTSTTTIAAGSIAGGISGGTVMKIAGTTALFAVIGTGLFVALNNHPAPAAAESTPTLDAPPPNKDAPTAIDNVLMAAAESPAVDAPPEEPSNPTTWQCPIRGVVRTLSGEPVEGASVNVTLTAQTFPITSAEILATGHATTDRDGLFVVTVPREYGKANVAQILAQKGNQVAFVPASLGSTYKDSQWPLTLAEVTNLSGKVVDSRGNPVEAATITPFQRLADAAINRPMMGGYTKALTDRNGVFVLGNIWKGTWNMGVEAPGYKTQSLKSISTSDANVLITMERGNEPASEEASTTSYAGAIEGEVVDDATGDGIAGVPVYAINADTREKGNATTGSDGHFAISALPSGVYTLSYEWSPFVCPARMDDKNTYKEGIRIDDQPVSGVVLRVDRRYCVQGTVATEDGTLVAGIFVTIIAEDQLEGVSPIITFPTVWTDHAGRFIGYLRGTSSKFFLQASKPGWASPFVGPLRVDQDGLSDVMLTAEPAASISGRWINAAGHAGRAMATLKGKRYGSKKSFAFGGASSEVVEWMSIGEPFYIGDLIADTYTITYWDGNTTESDGPVFSRAITLGPGEALRDLVLQPTQTNVCTVSGTVRFAGEPVSGASVFLTNGANSTSGTDGTYACTSLAEGEATLEANCWAPDEAGNQVYRFLFTPVVLEMNRTINLDVAFASGAGVIEGVVLYDDRPVAGVDIRTEIKWDDGSRELVDVRTYSQGRYRISGLPEGPRTIDVRSQEGKSPAIKDTLDIEVLPEGITHADLVYYGGTLCVQARGMGDGEIARLVVVPGQVEIEAITPELVDDLGSEALWSREILEDGDHCENIPSGVYTVIVGAFDNHQPDIESTLATLRWKSLFAEVAAGMETVVQVELE